MNLFLYNESKQYRFNWKGTVITVYNKNSMMRAYEKSIYTKHGFKQFVEELAKKYNMTMTTRKLF
jgi:hypothetical protein